MRNICAMLVSLAVVASASADWQANLGPARSSGLPGGHGGSFGVALRDLAGGATIPSGLKFGPSLGETWASGTLNDSRGRTFCVEGVTMNTNTWYYPTIDNVVRNGDGSQITILTQDVREVFAHYATDSAAFGLIKSAYPTLSWGSYTGSWNKVMQAFFWDQMRVDAPNGNENYNALSVGAQRDAYNALVAMTGAGLTVNLGSVKVFNLWSNAARTGDKQSHLVLIVPVPGAALLGVLGLGIAGWAKRRMA